MKIKTFYLSSDGFISRHKMRGKMMAGFGILWENQYIIAHTTHGNEHWFVFEDVKVGAHTPNILITLPKGEQILKIDIVTKA